ncbi:WhiB family transcriptional regulator [Streptomyces sp. CRN 30]|uniref:WhiB family transcriptional regulator n=1 Tax=Streptomyces sp. CRN 30 TaxID=3075613 RepID=UPI002A7EB295|nr:WhiB family transcriptional regulator [Streptomyces sp. CRN 30]
MTAAAMFRQDWEEAAACRGQDLDAWFPRRLPSAVVLATCRGCPVRAECLYDDLTTSAPRDRYGIRAGLTRTQRGALPSYTEPPEDVLPVLRELLARDDQTNPLPTERNPMSQPVPVPAAPPVQPAPDTTSNAMADGPAKALTEQQLLAWADTHVDPDVQDQAARARVLMASLRTRHASDRELNAITEEETELAARLAELRSRKAELLPAKKAKPKGPGVDYPVAEVRTWAEAHGYTVPRTGRIRRDIVDAWRTATGTSTGTAS